jgi:hypothetical protein
MRVWADVVFMHACQLQQLSVNLPAPPSLSVSDKCSSAHFCRSQSSCKVIAELYNLAAPAVKKNAVLDIITSPCQAVR